MNGLTSVDDVKNALVNYGSLAVSIASEGNFDEAAKPSNLNEVMMGKDIPQAVNKCPFVNGTNGHALDHAVTIVGWNRCTVS